MRTRTLLLLLAVFSWFPVTSWSNQNAPDAHLPNSNSAIQLTGKAVFGVDVLGRFAIALDTTGDGALDHFWQFTADKYLPGPWFKASEVRIIYRQGRLALQTLDNTYFVAVSVQGEPLMKQPVSAANSFAYENGVSLLAANGITRKLSGFEPMDLKAWPAGFSDSDVLNPNTGPTCGATPQWYFSQGCACGGPGGAQSCSIGGCSNAPTSLSITCKAGCSACCSCVQFNPPPSNRAGCFCMGPETPPE